MILEQKDLGMRKASMALEMCSHISLLYPSEEGFWFQRRVRSSNLPKMSHS